MMLSVIIACYNAESTLQRCLRSVFEQDAEASLFEVIAVNDGSTDGTQRLLQDSQERHGNLRVISQCNQGVSAARNAALRVAAGRYVTFLDADDSLGQHSLSALLDACCQCDDDLIVCQSHCGQCEHYSWSQRFEAGTSCTPHQLIEREYIRGSACGMAFRTQLLADHTIRFVGGLHYGEDTQFVLEAMLFCRTVRFQPIPLYEVVGASDSASRTFTPARVRRHTEGLAHLFRHIGMLAAAPERADILAYMRYIPLSVLVADTLNTPGAGIRLLLQLGVRRYSRMLSVPQSTPFLRRKIQLLRLSFSLYYLSVKLKQ